MLLEDKELPKQEQYKAGQNIFVEEHPCSNAYLITSGRVELTFFCGGQDRMARIAGKGDLIAELDWLNGGRHLFSARALEATGCLKIPYAKLVRQYLDAPSPVRGILRNAVNMFRGIKGETKLVTSAEVSRIIQSINSDQSILHGGCTGSDIVAAFDSFRDTLE